MKLHYITNGIQSSGRLERVLAVKASHLADKFNYKVNILALNDGNNEQFYKSIIEYQKTEPKENHKSIAKSEFLSNKLCAFIL